MHTHTHTHTQTEANTNAAAADAAADPLLLPPPPHLPPPNSTAAATTRNYVVVSKSEMHSSAAKCSSCRCKGSFWSRHLSLQSPKCPAIQNRQQIRFLWPKKELPKWIRCNQHRWLGSGRPALDKAETQNIDKQKPLARPGQGAPAFLQISNPMPERGHWHSPGPGSVQPVARPEKHLLPALAALLPADLSDAQRSRLLCTSHFHRCGRVRQLPRLRS